MAEDRPGSFGPEATVATCNKGWFLPQNFTTIGKDHWVFGGVGSVYDF
jgi:hypothetical protein